MLYTVLQKIYTTRVIQRRYLIYWILWNLDKKRHQAASNDVLILSTQFDEPFAYSTNTWARGDDCHKDVRRFRPVQRLHTGGASGHAAHKMNVIMLAEKEKEFKYWLKSVANPPNMKFIIPGRYLQFI